MEACTVSNSEDYNKLIMSRSSVNDSFKRPPHTKLSTSKADVISENHLLMTETKKASPEPKNNPLQKNPNKTKKHQPHSVKHSKFQ